MASRKGFCESCNLITPNIRGAYCCFCGSELYILNSKPANQCGTESDVVAPADAHSPRPAPTYHNESGRGTILMDSPTQTPAVVDLVNSTSSEAYANLREDNSNIGKDDDILTLFCPSTGGQEVNQARAYSSASQNPRRQNQATFRSGATSRDKTKKTNKNKEHGKQLSTIGVARRRARDLRSLSSPDVESRKRGTSSGRPSRKEKNPAEVKSNLATLRTVLCHDWEVTGPRVALMKRVIRNILVSPFAAPFKEPVDFITLNLPSYPKVIKQPMDLGRILEKLNTKKYDTVTDFIDDFELIINNSITFNGPEHSVTTHARKIEASFLNQMRNFPPTEVRAGVSIKEEPR
ncbi:uncharacterized protein PV06_09588 [Exophiala oligosperma]|uniref:Bromo domain-containing protein n=1 Tax=Exophiala oligosperma TaxID=215243 RepID=A0A0D2D876_9EURO|nr:uncharacterized protein PV06_09588 [Exophiala oligosperma]KIW38635.1 hypothetical protein PV06_09588 [Exophiala oligosperma]